MTVPQEQEVLNMGELYWSAELEASRTPSPGISAKRLKMTFDDIANNFRQEVPAWMDDEFNNLLRVQRTPQSLGYDEVDSFKALFSSNDSPFQSQNGMKKKMQTGCIPCLYVG